MIRSFLDLINYYKKEKKSRNYETDSRYYLKGCLSPFRFTEPSYGAYRHGYVYFVFR